MLPDEHQAPGAKKKKQKGKQMVRLAGFESAQDRISRGPPGKRGPDVPKGESVAFGWDVQSNFMSQGWKYPFNKNNQFKSMCPEWKHWFYLWQSLQPMSRRWGCRFQQSHYIQIGVPEIKMLNLPKTLNPNPCPQMKMLILAHIFTVTFSLSAIQGACQKGSQMTTWAPRVKK